MNKRIIIVIIAAVCVVALCVYFFSSGVKEAREYKAQDSAQGK